jgi:cyclopropane fatty-acyl-phospholipid synthase-like methyltransferase
MEWFEEWFDTPLYEKLYADRNEEEAEQLGVLIRKLLPVERYPDLLDLGCGRGRHSLTLAEHGYRVTGVDLSEEAIRKARRKAEERGLKSPRFLVGDMRVSLGRTFDAVVNLFTSFGYFERESENLKVFESIHSMLRMNGYLMIDYMNAARVRRVFEPHDEGEFQQIRYEIERFIDGDAIVKRIRFKGGILEGQQEYVERVKLYEEPWFRKQLDRFGFSVVNLFGNYHGSPFDPEKSNRLVILAKKED